MDKIIKMNNQMPDDTAIEAIDHSLTEVTDQALQVLHTNIVDKPSFSVPIAQLSSLGAGIASLLPVMNTVKQTFSMNVDGLYKLANASVGDTLKIAKNGNFWGAFRTADGASKFAQLQEAGPISVTSNTVSAINPATMMMAVALFSIEEQLGDIAEMEKQILSFLEVEKESEIEADVRTLCNIIENYKYNWDNSLYVASNHKMVLDIQRSARAHMLSYQMKVSEDLKSKKLLVGQKTVETTLGDFLKKFKYYRLSLYSYSLASLIEIMLSGNFKEEYIKGVRRELEQQSMIYRDLYAKCSVHLEKMAGSSVEKNLLKGLGNTGKAVGKLIGAIPVVNRGQVDEFLQDSGAKLAENAELMKVDIVKSFAEINDPGTRVFIHKMEDMIQIYNHTSEIGFDDQKIYLIS